MRDPATSMIYILLIYFFGPFDLFKFGNVASQASGFNEKKRQTRFISFDPNDGKIDIELDLSVPFISVPLNSRDKDKDGRPKPLVTINTKGIAVLGILLATSAFIVPLFIKPASSHAHHYRMDEELQWWNAGHSVNDVLLRNGYVTPCVQRVLCSVVTTIKHSENPTSTEKIIDGLVSHRWFEQFANGSVIMDAITTGQGTQKDCVTAYKKCPVTQKIIDNTLRALSII